MNTWEPEEHLDASLIAVIRKHKEEVSNKETNVACPSTTQKLQTNSSDDTYCYGFDRGLEAEKILGKCFERH